MWEGELFLKKMDFKGVLILVCVEVSVGDNTKSSKNR